MLTLSKHLNKFYTALNFNAHADTPTSVFRSLPQGSASVATGLRSFFLCRNGKTTRSTGFLGILDCNQTFQTNLQHSVVPQHHHHSMLVSLQMTSSSATDEELTLPLLRVGGFKNILNGIYPTNELSSVFAGIGFNLKPSSVTHLLSVQMAWQALFKYPSMLSYLPQAGRSILPQSTSTAGMLGSYNNLTPCSKFFTSKMHFLVFSAAQRKYCQFYEDAVVSDVLIRLLESLTLTRVWLNIQRAVHKFLTPAELSYLQLLRLRLNRQLRSQQAKRLWRYVGTCLLLTCKTKDLQFLMTWLHNKLSRVSSFTHKRFLTFFLFLLKSVLLEMGDYYGVVGCRVDVVGKISVAGNARSRSIIFKQGKTSFANTQIKVANEFYLVRTNTGCLGLTIWLFYL